MKIRPDTFEAAHQGDGEVRVRLGVRPGLTLAFDLELQDLDVFLGELIRERAAAFRFLRGIGQVN